MSDNATDPVSLSPAEKVKTFPLTPGVYLMKDASGKVIYVGKAKNLRNRAGSYFNAPAAIDRRTAELVKHIAALRKAGAQRRKTAGSRFP